MAARQSDRYGDSGLRREEEGDYRMAQTAVALLKEFAKTKQHSSCRCLVASAHAARCAEEVYRHVRPGQDSRSARAAVEPQGCPYPNRVTGGNPDIFMKSSRRRSRPGGDRRLLRLRELRRRQRGHDPRRAGEAGAGRNTIVFFLGDHGFHLGDHGFWSKYSMLEATRRAPLMVRVPGAPANGQVCREFVEFVDFVPTLGELLGSICPRTSKAPASRRCWPTRAGRGRRPCSWPRARPTRSCATAQYSYMEFAKGPVPAAPFDLEKDPWETVNLADDPAYAEARSQMAEALKAGWKAALPPEK